MSSSGSWHASWVASVAKHKKRTKVRAKEDLESWTDGMARGARYGLEGALSN
ncbi:MAG: hypothetical protein JWN48_4265 [Myxococcaceae bacterium]|nr:hypothetical protein [Myxococcaceae bacterium]